MSIAASGDGFTSSEDEGAVGLPPSGVVATAAPDPELTAMLTRAAALAAKAYSASGQAASALHAMAILQVRQGAQTGARG